MVGWKQQLQDYVENEDVQEFFLTCAMYQLANDIAKVPRTHGDFKLRRLKNMLRD